MSIETAITAAQGRVADCYTAISNKGGTLPATQNLSNMPTAINSISGGSTPVINSLNVTPTTSAQTITAPSGIDGYSPVNVSAVTSSIDANISAGNIKSGVSILGVSGSVTELKGETRSVSLTSSSGNTFTPTSGKNGITSITVTPNNQARSVTPSTSAQTLNVNSGYSGNGTISVSAVTSSIDNNITAGNIKKDVTILGVTGTYQGGITPSGTLSITANGVYDVTNYASANVSVSGGTSDWVTSTNFTISLHKSYFKLGDILDTVGYRIVGEDSSNGEIKVVGCLYDANGNVIVKSNGHYLAFNCYESLYEEGDGVYLVFQDADDGDMKTLVYVDLS